MATIGELAVNVVANTQKFIRNMRGAQKQAKGFKATIANTSTAVFGFSKALAGIAGVGVAISFVNRLRQDLDRLGKTASKLGIGTKALSELQFAAEQSGLETNQFNTALQRLARRGSEAARGTGESVKAFRELRINARELVKLPLDKQLEVIAQQMADVKTQSDRVRLAFKLFDTEGVGMVNLFEGGAEAIRKLRTEARQVGRSFDDVGVDSVENLNDELNKAISQIRGPMTQAFIDLAPHITTLAKGVSGLATTISFLQDPNKLSRDLEAIRKNQTGFTLNPTVPREATAQALERFGPVGAERLNRRGDLPGGGVSARLLDERFRAMERELRRISENTAESARKEPAAILAPAGI